MAGTDLCVAYIFFYGICVFHVLRIVVFAAWVFNVNLWCARAIYIFPVFSVPVDDVCDKEEVTHTAHSLSNDGRGAVLRETGWVPGSYRKGSAKAACGARK